MVGKKFKTRNGKREVTVIGDKSLSGQAFAYCLICSDTLNRLKDGRVLNNDIQHPLDLILE